MGPKHTAVFDHINLLGPRGTTCEELMKDFNEHRRLCIYAILTYLQRERMIIRLDRKRGRTNQSVWVVNRQKIQEPIP